MASATGDTMRGKADLQMIEDRNINVQGSIVGNAVRWGRLKMIS